MQYTDDEQTLAILKGTGLPTIPDSLRSPVAPTGRPVTTKKRTDPRIKQLTTGYGIDVPESKSAKVGFLIQPSLKKDLQKVCKKQGISLAEGFAVAARLFIATFGEQPTSEDTSTKA